MIPDLKTFTLLAATLVHMGLFAKGWGWIWSQDVKVRCTAGLRMLPVHSMASLHCTPTYSDWTPHSIYPPPHCLFTQWLPSTEPQPTVTGHHVVFIPHSIHWVGNRKCVCEELCHSPLATAGEVGELEGLLDKRVYWGCTACHSAALLSSGPRPAVRLCLRLLNRCFNSFLFLN